MRLYSIVIFPAKIAFLILLSITVFNMEAFGEPKPKVEVFVTSWCSYCRALEKTLHENKITYTRYDIEKDEGAERKYLSLGARGIPVTRIDGTVISGYQPDVILGLIKKR